MSGLLGFVAKGGSMVTNLKPVRSMLARTGLVEEGRAGEPEPAEIHIFDDPSASEIAVIPCRFRPAQVTISKSAEWAEEVTAENDVPMLSYVGGHSARLTMDLFFDTTDTGDDVRQYTDLLLELPRLDKDSGMPLLCRFVWGEMQSFFSYVEKVDVTFTMFLYNGKPVRAEVPGITFIEYDEFAPGFQNPTSRSEARKTWVVQEGQRLDWIAYKEYGDAAHWRHIAEVNGLADPRAIRPGQILKLTPLP
jgi:nucleoid-associated protein YgaU